MCVIFKWVCCVRGFGTVTKNGLLLAIKIGCNMPLKENRKIISQKIKVLGAKKIHIFHNTHKYLIIINYLLSSRVIMPIIVMRLKLAYTTLLMSTIKMNTFTDEIVHICAYLSAKGNIHFSATSKHFFVINFHILFFIKMHIKNIIHLPYFY